MKFVKLILIFFIVFGFKTKTMEGLPKIQLNVIYNNIKELFKEIKFLATGKWYKKALWKAIRTNDLTACEELIKKGADPNSIYYRYKSFLCEYICRHNPSIDMIKLLIQYGVDVSYGSGGYTPLMYAVGTFNLDVAKILLESEADPNVAINGYTVLGNSDFKKFYQTYLFKNKYKKTAKEKLESVLDICNLPKDLHNNIFDYYIDENINIDNMQKDLNIKK